MTPSREEEDPMLKFWSEVPAARAREVAADLATSAWVALWTVVGASIHDTIAAFAEAGRILQGGGLGIQGAGASLGGALRGVPLVGEGIDDLTSGAFVTAGEPFIFVGQELESLRAPDRSTTCHPGRRRDAHPVVESLRPLAGPPPGHRPGSPPGHPPRPAQGLGSAMEQALATRAINRLSYADLLDHTPDPFGDFASGRFDRLARAELASVGLR